MFNDVVRLKKPPLMYWLVMGLDALKADGPTVSEATTRMPFAIAATMLVLVTMLLGGTSSDQSKACWEDSC